MIKMERYIMKLSFARLKRAFLEKQKYFFWQYRSYSSSFDQNVDKLKAMNFYSTQFSLIIVRQYSF